MLDSAPVSTSTKLAGAAGVAARFLDALLLLPERRLGVLERRAERVRREEERFLDFLEGRREAERRFGVRERAERVEADFGVRERAERLEADLDREVDRRRLPLRFFGDFGVLARLAARRRRAVPRRSAARRLEAFGVRDRRALLFLEDLREVDLDGRRDGVLEADFFGPFGVLARRRLEAERDLEAEREEGRRSAALGALARRAALRRFFEVRGRLLGLFGVLARLAERREDLREDFREAVRLAFFTFFSSSSSFRARFFLGLIPISLFLFAIISVLYSSFSLT